jgi:hypothetical protein
MATVQKLIIQVARSVRDLDREWSTQTERLDASATGPTKLVVIGETRTL